MKTVYVIGAGASKEVGLPTGEELKDRISKLLDIKFDRVRRHRISGDENIIEALRLHAKETTGCNITPFVNEARRISNALILTYSIDNFIDMHKGNKKIALCGKLAIVRSILEAEKNDNKLYFDKHKANATINFNDLKETWYIPFFRTLTENCTKRDLPERFKDITLIIFNYDRCIEHFLYHALQQCYDINKSEAAELVRAINIFHPYGSVGTLPWLHENGNIELGSELKPEKLLELTKEIKTFTEGTNPNSSKISEIKSRIAQANRLVLLGFAFHKLNMKLIRPKQEIQKGQLVNIERPKGNVSCYATAYGFSDSDQNIIKRQIRGLYGTAIIINNDNKAQISNSTCNQFFTDFSKSLSFE